MINSKKPVIIIGENFANRVDNLDNFILKLKNSLPNKNTNIFSLKNSSNSEGMSMLNFKERSSKVENNIIAINLDDNITNRRLYLNSNKTQICLNTHGSYLASKFKIILPIFTTFEEELIYINLEGRPQKTQKISSHSSNIRSVENFILALFNIEEHNIVYNYISGFGDYLTTLNSSTNFDSLKCLDNILNTTDLNYSSDSILSNYPIKQNNKDFFNYNNFTRNSPTMQKCSAESIKNFTNFYKSI